MKNSKRTTKFAFRWHIGLGQTPSSHTHMLRITRPFRQGRQPPAPPTNLYPCQIEKTDRAFLFISPILTVSILGNAPRPFYTASSSFERFPKAQPTPNPAAGLFLCGLGRPVGARCLVNPGNFPAEPGHADDTQLVLAAQSGDRAAFGALVERHGDPLFRWLWHLTRRHDLAEDLTQESLLRAFTRLDQFEAGTNFRGWLFRIGHNAHANWCRSKARRREETLPPGTEGRAPATSASPPVLAKPTTSDAARRTRIAGLTWILSQRGFWRREKKPR